jgi:hypothetical protein
VIGTRGLMLCRERGVEPTWSLPMATQISAVRATSRQISEELFSRFARGLLAGVDVVYACHFGGERSEIRRERYKIPTTVTLARSRSPLILTPE